MAGPSPAMTEWVVRRPKRFCFAAAPGHGRLSSALFYRVIQTSGALPPPVITL
jgi:hypothetical protein